ncbi:alanine dehydrogenase [Salsuginibacillus kocurii]|uniref:alanine dehydrogenase n=1 Tax=Salsuginibacillus kocurii TaxID=427078 RepID=UPI000369590F|nr:alanine dehydrogenase [Salsuginibacillus kocurii]
MIIGLPKEIKSYENRVALTPEGVSSLVKSGHKVLMETSAGAGSGFEDGAFVEAGADLRFHAAEIWQEADMVVKVKEPVAEEYKYFRKDLILFTYLHLAANQKLVEELVAKEVTALAYETIQKEDGSLPLLTPMSEIAGRMAVQAGSHHLEKREGGLGLLLSGVPGVEAGKVTIIGGGVVGTNAAKVAVGMGADVTVFEKDSRRLRQLSDLFGKEIRLLKATPQKITDELKSTNLLIGAVLVPGAKAPSIVDEEMVKQMPTGSVIVDVAVDQGGCIATVDRVTTHDHPVYIKHGVVHYGVANIPGIVPYTATVGLTNETLPYIEAVANHGVQAACEKDAALRAGLNCDGGQIVLQEIADLFGYQYQ